MMNGARTPASGSVPRALRKRDERLRAPEQIALSFAALVAAQDGQLILVLDAFGEHRDGQAAAEGDDGAHDRFRLGASHELVDEEPVELDLVERERAQRLERRISGAEIVEGDGNAERLYLSQRFESLALVGDDRRLGDLELQPLRCEPGLHEDVVDDFGQSAAGDLPGERLTAIL